VQLVVLLIFAALAAVVLYNLHAVLGRRIGRQPGENAEASQPQAPLDRRLPAPDAPMAEVELSGLAALKARDPSFDIDKFIQGARSAYEVIVRAFASGDRQTLKGLLAPDVMARFEQAMAAREAEGRTESAEFVHPPRTDIEDSQVDGDEARVRVRFLGEFTSRTKIGEGEETAEERRTAEAWTFQRNLASRDPNWTLVRVDAAEA
jgi:predicted lipid-binding transport protein (Tim44 family)